MKRRTRWLCAALLIAAVPGILRAADVLPLRTQELVAEKYAGFSGVLRVWICEGWTDGDAFSGWLNRCFSQFERAHEGVYVEATHVDEAALADLRGSGLRPPDAILFAPGMAVDAGALAPLNEMPVREALRGCGGGIAVPVALGGYAWVCNRDAADAAGSLAALAAARPADEPYRAWSAALLALGGADEAEIEDPGIDLGLPEAAPAVSSAGALPDATARLSAFAAGELAAIPVTQREIARLVRLDEQGGAPDWTIGGAAAFTDQLLMMAVVAGGGERQALAEALAAQLLAEECQAMLADYGMFNVVDALTGYAANSPYRAIDLALHAQSLIVPPALDGSWRERSSAALDGALSGGDPIAQLQALVAKQVAREGAKGDAAKGDAVPLGTPCQRV